MFKTCREILDIKGSNEHKSIQGLEYAMSWDTVSPGVNGVSTGVRGDMMGAGTACCLCESSCGISARWFETKARTLEWKCGLVMGLVTISY